ncbi:hypothetical protein [Saccharibacillus sp. JS10]|uniref:hypothetical protein n=1 Tax=Saccharibacillus sp. JS10 TaxID=2950552 RepID=UPI00210F1199|nr:hypothetical protein [Saccharibacillus sp. JS10]MCQ4086673.1 hypothetical protein [Saccharibacillus sp. JS10]
MNEITKSSGSTSSESALYPASAWMEHAESLFGVRAEVVHGALCQQKAKHFTKQQVTEQINQFMKAKVK